MSDFCIFESNKVCNDCGECNICELNRNKKCDNCGKCLELEGYDVKAIRIDEVIENKGSNDPISVKLDRNSLIKDKVIKIEDIMRKKSRDTRDENKKLQIENNEEGKAIEIDSFNKVLDIDEEALEGSLDIMDNEDMWEYIEDVTDLSEILNDDKLFGELAHEQFPGFVVLDKDRKSRE